jgi:hypothetical protein
METSLDNQNNPTQVLQEALTKNQIPNLCPPILDTDSDTSGSDTSGSDTSDSSDEPEIES